MDLARNEIMLEGEDAERLVYIAKSALRVFNEHQFFTWTQGELQSLLPHEILVCCTGYGKDSKLRHYRFSSTRYFRTEHFQAVCDPVDGVFTQMMQRTRRTGMPCVLGEGVVLGAADREWLPLLERNEMRNAAAHGLRGPDGQMKSYFCFSRVLEDLSQHTLDMLEALLPHLDAALARVAAHDAAKNGGMRSGIELLSKREIQVLEHVMAGKTNQTIADELSLSPLTVKNHVQNILKKLKVRTRGHAVASGFRLGLLKPGGEMAENEA